MKDTINGVSFFYQWLQPYRPSLPTLVALHGFTGSSESFRPVFAEVGSYNVLAIDLIGH
ncbi:2-succinyl-6-hydroxy-2,4-cyclohexadiene-1-carboxylate synthase, partial [Listeria monocytogenes]|nr:2-succinyl-6-hydroxy-2,4-cyclohexadiene-1-carboxylate synthase [Listeria monocytogenes]